MPETLAPAALKSLDSLVDESTNYQNLISESDWPALELALTIRQEKLSALFQEYPGIADNPIIREKLQKLITIDAESVDAMQQQRDISDHEIGELKRNAQAVKHYIDVNQQSR
jgi:hypothetical protein